MSQNSPLSVLSSVNKIIFLEKKQHTIKVQLIICLITLKILMVYCAKETVHDFKILKNSRVAINLTGFTHYPFLIALE